MHCKIIKVFAFCLVSILLIQCEPVGPHFPAGQVQGYRPVYASDTEKTITFSSARSVQKPGKIYIYGNYLLVNEREKGIHFFNNADPTAPEPIGFLSVEGNVDMAIKGNVLYVDHLSSMVALNIADLNDIKELSRFRTWINNLPPDEGRYFECIDPEKGEVIGWELVTLNNPKCYR
jgi:hypothetical protein